MTVVDLNQVDDFVHKAVISCNFVMWQRHGKKTLPADISILEKIWMAKDISYETRVTPYNSTTQSVSNKLRRSEVDY